MTSDIACEGKYDERTVPAEYRTDVDHVQVLRTAPGSYLVRERVREINTTSGRYSQWTEWRVKLTGGSLLESMWMFARLVLQKSSVDEYRWGAAARSIYRDFTST